MKSVTFFIVLATCSAIQPTPDVQTQNPRNESLSLAFLEVTLVDILRNRTSGPLIIVVLGDFQDNCSSQQAIIMDTLERHQIQSLIVEVINVVKIFSSSLLRVYKDNIFIITFFKELPWSKMLNIYDVDSVYGNKFILQHFAKWIVIDTCQQNRSLTQPTHGVIQDHVALITTNERNKTCLTSSMENPVETNVSAFTLVWTKEGREWRQIPINAHSVAQRLFPNTKYGLNRRELVCAVLPWPPSLKIKDVNGTNMYSGASVNIMMILAQEFNFSFRFVSPDDEQWGTKLNNSWNGIIGMLQKGEADLCPVPYARNPDRNQVLEFSNLFAYTPTHAVSKSPTDRQKNWKLLLLVFEWEVYITCVASLVYVLALIWLVGKIHHLSNPSVPSISVSEILHFGFGPLFRQGLYMTPTSQSGRILLGSWWIFCVIFTSVYTSQLTAGFTTSRDSARFTNLDQLALDNDYRVGISSFNFLRTIFQNSNSSTYRILSEKIRKNCSPKLMNATMESACHRKNLRDGGYAFITSINEINDLKADICHLSVMPEMVVASSTGMIFPRHSPLAEMFSHSLLIMSEFGLIDKWTIEHTPEPKKCHKKETSTTVVNINMFLNIFLTCSIGIFLASIILIIEKCSQRYST